MNIVMLNIETSLVSEKALPIAKLMALLSALFMSVEAFSESIILDCSANRGELVAFKCIACHEVTGNSNGVGPGLGDVLGRTIASVSGFDYSEALSQRNDVWSPELLSEFLLNPQSFAPGNVMAFSGLKNDQERADIVCFFLEQTKKEINKEVH